MECRDEQERFENGVLPRDIIFTPEILALQALLERRSKENETGAETFTN